MLRFLIVAIIFVFYYLLFESDDKKPDNKIKNETALKTDKSPAVYKTPVLDKQTPIDDLNTNNKNTEPVKTENTNTEPVKTENTAPVKPENTNTEPVKTENTAPVKPENTNTEPVKPENTAPVKPENTNTAPVKPENTAPVKPENTNTAPVKPENTAPVKPENTAPVKPENTNTEPVINQDPEVVQPKTKTYKVLIKKLLNEYDQYKDLTKIRTVTENVDMKSMLSYNADVYEQFENTTILYKNNKNIDVPKPENDIMKKLIIANKNKDYKNELILSIKDSVDKYNPFAKVLLKKIIAINKIIQIVDSEPLTLTNGDVKIFTTNTSLKTAESVVLNIKYSDGAEFYEETAELKPTTITVIINEK